MFTGLSRLPEPGSPPGCERMITFSAKGSSGSESSAAAMLKIYRELSLDDSILKRYQTDNLTTRAGGAVQAGRRQSMPSHSIANCAAVSRAASAGDGHGKRPFSRTLYLTLECSPDRRRSPVSAGHASVSSIICAATAMCGPTLQPAR